jgi:hypothetical protein
VNGVRAAGEVGLERVEIYAIENQAFGGEVALDERRAEEARLLVQRIIVRTQGRQEECDSESCHASPRAISRASASATSAPE